MNAEQLLKETKVPYFYRVTYNISQKEISLWNWVTTYSSFYKDRIEQVRKVKTFDDKQSKELKKELLPCVTISAQIEGTRKTENITKHNPIICIDIDREGNPNITDWNEVKQKIMTLPFVIFSSLSCRGDGVFCFVYYDTSKDFLKVWNSLKHDFKEMDIVIDEACKDEIRLRFISYDNNCYLRRNVEIYNKELEYKIEEQPEKKYNISNTTLSTDDYFTYKSIYYLIKECNYRANNYSDWLLDAFRLATFDCYGELLFMYLSQKSDNYDFNSAQAKFLEATNKTKMNKSCLSYYFSILKSKLGTNWRNIIEEYSHDDPKLL